MCQRLRDNHHMTEEERERLDLLSEVYVIQREVIETARSARPKRRKKYDTNSEVGQLLEQL